MRSEDLVFPVCAGVIHTVHPSITDDFGVPRVGGGDPVPHLMAKIEP